MSIEFNENQIKYIQDVLDDKELKELLAPYVKDFASLSDRNIMVIAIAMQAKQWETGQKWAITRAAIIYVMAERGWSMEQMCFVTFSWGIRKDTIELTYIIMSKIMNMEKMESGAEILSSLLKLIRKEPDEEGLENEAAEEHSR